MTKRFTTILLIGEGGLLKQLGKRLLHHNHSVWALLSTEGLAPVYASLGINPLVADLSDPFLAKMAVTNADVIYHLAARRVHGTPMPEPVDLKGLQNILSVIPPGSIRRFIYESGLAVYDGLAGDVLDENAICRPKSATGRIFFEAEREILSRFSKEGFPGVILRSAAIYQPVPGVYDQVRKGTYQIPPDLPQILHRIYIEDYLDILVAAMEKGGPGQIYNVADQEPHTPGQYFSFMALSMGMASPPPLLSPDFSRSARMIRHLNGKLLNDFGLSLRFPTFREGVLNGIQRAQAEA